MRSALTALLLIAAAPAAAQSIEVATGDWDSVPRIGAKGQPMLSAATAARVDEIAKAGKCDVPGVNRRYVDLNVPFVVEFLPSGDVQRIVLAKLGCLELEGVLGGVLKSWADAGKYAATGENQLGWYRGDIKILLR